mmetsp:Transcript_48661/g.122434  ORF Transcript_48661/g.122434 Transcript_48661/m.122434 type:complete len:256 (-) Transcript_48661:30-797(-)
MRLVNTIVLVLSAVLLLILARSGAVYSLSDGEVAALRDLQDAWNLKSWQNRSISCELPGLSCDPNGHVYRLTLLWPPMQAETTGPIPDSIGQLRWLILLQLRLPITGSLPEGIGGLTSLLGLEISGGLEGPLPRSLGTLTRLQGILLQPTAQLYGPALNGSLTLLQELPNLTTFSAPYNQFSGSLPPTLASSQLQKLELHSNKLTGVVPEWVCGVQAFSLQGNSFACPLPSCCLNSLSFRCANSQTVPCFPPNDQ